MLHRVEKALQQPEWHSWSEKILKAISAGTTVVAIILFVYQVYLAVDRYVAEEIGQIVNTVKQPSLPMPVVTLKLQSTRNGNSTEKPTILYFMGSQNNEAIPSEYFIDRRGEISGSTSSSYLIANIINLIEIENSNQILSAFEEQWPLKLNLGNSFGYGMNLIGIINATNFIEYPDEYGNEDRITLTLSSFETDSISSTAIGLDYQLL